MNWESTVNRLNAFDANNLPGQKAQERMLPSFRGRPSLVAKPDARESAVLIVLYPLEGNTQIVLIERSADGGKHSGQIALPGGKKETTDIDLKATALREAEEEINLNPSSIKMVANLSPLYISVSNFSVQPYIALSQHTPILSKSEYEVNRIIFADLGRLFHSQAERKIQIPSMGNNIYLKTPVYTLEDSTIIWGATAMILAELEVLLIH